MPQFAKVIVIARNRRAVRVWENCWKFIFKSNLISPVWSHHNMAYHIALFHNDVMAWKRFRHYWPFVRGIHHWSQDNSSHTRPEVLTFGDFFVVSLNKALGKQLICWWFELPYCSCVVDTLSYHLNLIKLHFYENLWPVWLIFIFIYLKYIFLNDCNILICVKCKWTNLMKENCHIPHFFILLLQQR